MIKELIKIANELDSRGLRKEADYLDSIINKDASFIPKKIEPFRVKITGGRFEGGQGMASDRYDDGVFGIDLDEPMYDSGRGFATEDQIERSDSMSEEEGLPYPEGESSAGASLTWINREEWESAKHSLRKYQIRQMAPDEESLRQGFERDVSSIQNALDKEGGSEAGYLVINPWETATFRKYVIHPRMAHPEGKEIAVPLDTFEREGKRINFFKINDWVNPEGKDLEGEGEEDDRPKGDRFGKVEE
jgi:hypothetical protein